MYHFVIRLLLEPGYLPKISNLMQNYFFRWKYKLHRNFWYGIHQQIRILRFHSDDNLFLNRPYCKELHVTCCKTLPLRWHKFIYAVSRVSSPAPGFDHQNVLPFKMSQKRKRGRLELKNVYWTYTLIKANSILSIFGENLNMTL